MSIASEITRLQAAKSDLATSIANKGVTVPANATLDDYPALVDSIQTGGGGFQYGSKIEYLESNGNQWINTGLYGSINLDYEVTAMVTSTSSEFHNILGDRYSSSQRRYTVMGDVISNDVGGYLNCGNSNQVVVGAQYRPTTKTTYKKVGRNVYVNDNLIGTFADQSFTTPNTITLFGARNNGSFSNNLIGRIYSCKFLNGNDVVLNLVPVRIGTVGYMYDLVGNKLYGNVGTGSFTLGPDVS